MQRDEHRHKDQDHRLDPTQQRGGLDVHVLIIEIGHVIQHFGQRARFVRQRESFRAPEFRKMSCLLQAVGKRLSFPNLIDGVRDGFGDDAVPGGVRAPLQARTSSGVPPCSSVARVRESCAMENIVHRFPRIGAFSFISSSQLPAACRSRPRARSHRDRR